MRFPVVDKSNGQVSWLSVKDILCCSTKEDGKITIHSKDGEFKMIKTLTEIETLLQDEGFVSLDKSNVVNKHKISGYDPCKKVVCFMDKPIQCCVSRRKIYKLK